MWRRDDRERAHARPPGVRRRERKAAEMRATRKSWKPRMGEDIPGMMKRGSSSGDMVATDGRSSRKTVQLVCREHSVLHVVAAVTEQEP